MLKQDAKFRLKQLKGLKKMAFDTATLRNDFARDGFAIAPNLFTRSEVQRLKLECIDILEAVKAETGAVAGHGVYVGLAARSPVFQTAVGDARLYWIS